MIDDVPIDAVWPGRPHPRGATWDGRGVNFALFSAQAEFVELCLFDRQGHERQRIELREQTDVARLIALRREHLTFRHADFFGGRRGDRTHGVRWLPVDGFELSASQWDEPHARCQGMFINCSALQDTDRRGRHLVDDDFLLLFNAHHEELGFLLPDQGGPTPWQVCIDTASAVTELRLRLPAASRSPLRVRYMALLMRPRRAAPWALAEAAVPQADDAKLELA